MKKYVSLEAEITKLAQLQDELNKQGGPSENGRLFEHIMDVQDDILKSFGLADIPENEKLVHFDFIPTSLELKKAIAKLKSAATEYLLTNARTDIQILCDAQEGQIDLTCVLAELKIPRHIYTDFILEEILLKRKDSIENVLHDLRFCNQPDILNALGLICFGTSDQVQENIESLKLVGVKYLNEFINYNSILLQDEDY